MADRTQLKVADQNHVADDDPFAELTRIMGFDPRQPARPQAPAVENAAPAKHAAEDRDFDIDLEKELMGEFDAVEEVAPLSQQAVAPVLAHDPAFETARAPSNDDELTASFEQDFVFDDAADHAHFAAPRAPEPTAADLAFDEDFDKAVANSLDVSPLEDGLPIDQEMAASLDRDFQIDHHDAAVARQDAAEAVQSASETAFDVDFDDAVQMSLEEELAFDGHEPEQHSEAIEAHPAHAVADRSIRDEDFAGHFDEAMADTGMDMGHHQDLPLEPEPAVEVAHFAAHPEPVVAPEPVAAVADHAFDDDFETSFRDALADQPEVLAVEPMREAAEPVAVTRPSVVQPAPVAPVPVPLVETVEPAASAAAASERSLEDELNALLGAMTARPLPAAKEVAPAPQQAAQPIATGHGDQKPAAADDLDWDIDEHEPAQDQQAARPADAELDDLLAGELDRQDFHAEHSIADPEPGIDFDDEAFDAALAKGIEPDREALAAAAPEALSGRPANSPDWLSSTPAEPAPSWGRATPVAAPAPASFAPQPAPSAPQPAAAPASRSEPVVDYSAYVRPAQTQASLAQASFAPQAAPPAPQLAAAPGYPSEPATDYATFTSPAPAAQSRDHDEMPDVETVDVPERVVALADDLDIPELSFEEDQPAAPAFDDLDAEFSSLLTEMNATDIAPATATSRTYQDDSYDVGFKAGYDRREMRAEAPATAPAAASYAAANDYDADNLPGSRPVSQADDFANDELDYDPELDEAIAIPGLAESEAAKPRRRGLMIAVLVGAVAIAGGLGALAFSFGGKGGSQAPVIVKADNAPIKVKPENPGGTVVPNQDNKVYDAVVKGGSAKPAEPVQQKLVTNTEEPVDLASKAPQSRVVDLAPDGTGAAAGADASGNPDAAAPGGAQATAPQSAQPAAPAPKSEDRIAQVLQDADKGTNTDVVAVAPRKVKTMMVKPDGSLVAREDPAPAAPKVAAAEPTDPAPQHVAPAGQSDIQQTGTVTPAADQAADQSGDQADTAKPAKPAAPKADAKAQSTNTPAKVPVAPPRPSDQPVDIVGEVKPDQVVASVDPAAASGGSWSMQIASQPTVESAQSTYQDLQRRYGSVLAGRTANIVKAEVAGKGTFYRVRVPAQSRNDAIALCTSYKAAGGNCFVSR